MHTYSPVTWLPSVCLATCSLLTATKCHVVIWLPFAIFSAGPSRKSMEKSADKVANRCHLPRWHPLISEGWLKEFLADPCLQPKSKQEQSLNSFSLWLRRTLCRGRQRRTPSSMHLSCWNASKHRAQNLFPHLHAIPLSTEAGRKRSQAPCPPEFWQPTNDISKQMNPRKMLRVAICRHPFSNTSCTP